MKEDMKDKGLRKATQEPIGFRLPSNFVYRTMQKVDQRALLRERQAERRTLWATIAASLVLLAGGIAYFLVFFGQALKTFFHAPTLNLQEQVSASVPYLWLMGMFLLLLIFDQWMRKKYFKRDM